MPQPTGAKMVVKLPQLPLTLRSRTNPEPKPKDKTVNGRMKQYRQKMKENHEKYEAMKDKKVEQNRKYTESIKQKRSCDQEFDDKMKKQQLKWQKKCRLKQKNAKRNKDNANSTNGANKKTPEQIQAPSVIDVSLKRATTQKRAEHLRNYYKSSPKSWGVTLAHVVDNATPKTKANFIERCKSVSATSSQHPEDQLAIVETFFPSTVGRPTKEQSIVRKALFTVPQVAAQAPKSAKKSQHKTKSSSLHISKPQLEHQAWRRKVQAFYERDDVSRVMPISVL